MKVNCVIVLGPSGEFHSSIGNHVQKFTLPFLNTSLLNITINYLEPYASKILIFCLNQQKDLVNQLTQDYKVSIEIIDSEYFEGMPYIFSILRSKLDSSFFVMCKGDIYGLEPLKPFLEPFLSYEADMYISMQRTSDDSTLMCLDKDNYLKMYNGDDFPFIKNERLFLTTDFAIKDFFIIKTSILNEIPDDLYSFKKNVISYFVNLKKKIKMVENDIIQIKNIDDYILQLEYKNSLVDMKNSSSCNLIDSDCNIGEEVFIEDSIIGEKCFIGYKSIIKRSIIMDNCTIEPYSVIDSCIIGRNSYVKKKTKLKNVKILESHIFE